MAEGPAKRGRSQVSWLGLHRWIPQRDVRKLIYRMCTIHERLVVEHAHGVKHRAPRASFLYHAACHGYLDLIKWAQCAGRMIGVDFGEQAAAHGHLHVLKHAIATRVTLKTNHFVQYAAAVGGRLHILQWLHSEKVPLACSLGTWAAGHGHLHVLQWVVEVVGCAISSSAIVDASRNGHRHVLEWIHAQRKG